MALSFMSKSVLPVTQTERLPGRGSAAASFQCGRKTLHGLVSHVGAGAVGFAGGKAAGKLSVLHLNNPCHTANEGPPAMQKKSRWSFSSMDLLWGLLISNPLKNPLHVNCYSITSMQNRQFWEMGSLFIKLILSQNVMDCFCHTNFEMCLLQG